MVRGAWTAAVLRRQFSRARAPRVGSSARWRRPRGSGGAASSASPCIIRGAHGAAGAGPRQTTDAGKRGVQSSLCAAGAHPPVLKHGLRSLTRVRVGGCAKTIGGMKVNIKWEGLGAIARVQSCCMRRRLAYGVAAQLSPYIAHQACTTRPCRTAVTQHLGYGAGAQSLGPDRTVSYSRAGRSQGKL